MDMNVQRENRIIDYIEKVYHIRQESFYIVHNSRCTNIDYIVDVYEYEDEDNDFSTISTFIVYSGGKIEFSHLVAL